MSDVESRILVAVEAGEALKRIGDVKGGIGEIIAAREKDLQTIRQKTASLKELAAAERTANQAAAKAQDKGFWANSRYGMASDVSGLSTSQQESIKKRSAALASTTTATRGAAVSVAGLSRVLTRNVAASKQASQGLQQFTARAIAAKSAGKLLGADVGDGLNPALIKTGIIAAGVTSAIKIARGIWDLHGKKLRENAEDAQRYAEAAKAITERNKELAERQRAAMDSLDSLRSKERLSNVDRLKTSELLKQLGADYRQLGIEIDASSGKVKNFDQANAKLERLQINREQDDIRRQLKNLETSRKRQLEIIAADSIVATIISQGRSSADAMAAAEKIDRIGEESAKLRQRFGELGKMNPEARAAAALKDRAQALGVLIEQENEQFAIQQMRLRGDETGAAWLERELELRKQIADLTEQELKDYEKVWRERQNAMQNAMQDQEHQKRLRALAEEFRIEKLLIRGDERRARLAQWQNEITGGKAVLSKEEISRVQRELKAREQLYQIRQFRERRDSLLESMRQVPAYRYRTTSQDAVYANSIEGMRMQTRVISKNPERELLKQQLKVLENMEYTLRRIRDNAPDFSFRTV